MIFNEINFVKKKGIFFCLFNHEAILNLSTKKKVLGIVPTTLLKIKSIPLDTLH